jgi:hypothetical protein
LFRQSHLSSKTRYLWAAGRWTLISQERSYMPTRNLSMPFRDLERLIIEWFFYHQLDFTTGSKSIGLSGNTGAALDLINSIVASIDNIMMDELRQPPRNAAYTFPRLGQAYLARNLARDYLRFDRWGARLLLADSSPIRLASGGALAWRPARATYHRHRKVHSERSRHRRCRRGDHQIGSAPTFEAARAGFEAAWQRLFQN